MMTGDRIDVAFRTDDAGTLPPALADADARLAVRTVDGPDAAAVPSDDRPDCVVIDGRLPESRVLSLLDAALDAEPTLPVLLYGGSGALVEAALDAGATDIIRPADTPVDARVAAHRIVTAVERGPDPVGLTSDADRESDPETPAIDRYDDLLAALLERSSDRLSVLDEEGNYVYVSPAVERMMGHDPDDLVGTSGFAYVHPDDRDRVEETFERVLDAPEEVFSIQYRVRDAEGVWRWVESRGSNRLDDPTVGGIVINSREITDRRERQRRLSEERAFTESVFAALPDVFYAFDADGNFLRWNEELLEATGYADEEIRSMHPVEFIDPDDRPAVAEAIARVFEAGETVTVEARFRTKDGETNPYEFTGAALTRPDGEVFGLVGIGRDISDRKRRRRRFEAVFNNTPQFLGLTNTDGTVLEANATVLEFVGTDREAFVGRRLWDTAWFRETPESAAAARDGVERARDGGVYTDEIEVRGTVGTETIDFSVHPITDDHGAVALLVVEGQRITEVKRRERHLEVLHRFLRHNLRNKMTIIQGTADVLADRLADPTDREYVSQIVGAATELIDLSETAHQLSRVAIGDDGDRRPVDLRATLTAIADDFEADNQGATIRVDVDSDHRVRADWRVRPMFEQLVENAIEHAGTDAPTVEITCRDRDDTTAVRIADDGPGIPRDELVGITTDEEPTQLTHGTGFGLWLVRSVVDDYGGRLEYEPGPDGGSVVIVRLPAVPADPPAAEEATSTDG